MLVQPIQSKCLILIRLETLIGCRGQTHSRSKCYRRCRIGNYCRCDGAGSAQVATAATENVDEFFTRNIHGGLAVGAGGGRVVVGSPRSGGICSSMSGDPQQGHRSVAMPRTL